MNPESEKPYSYEVAYSGCVYCGHGKRWRIKGPTKIDTDFMSEDDVKIAVDQANLLYQQIRQHVQKEVNLNEYI